MTSLTDGGAVEPPALEVRGIVKRFPGTLANDDVALTVRSGQVCAILGENGAGKSTLASILSGLYQPDRGEIFRRGNPVTLRSPREALGLGIGMVHQHFRLVNRFTVAENVALGDPSQPFFMSTPKVHRSIAAIGDFYDLPIEPSAVVADLSVGEQQRVEIVKTLYRGADVLILDEPTSVLTPQETESLFATIRKMTAEGKAVIFISHKLREVREISDVVTVMRSARVVGTVPPITAVEELARLMVGRDVDMSVRRRRAPGGDRVLELSGIHVDRQSRRGGLTGVSLEVTAGEIVGVAGVAGNGQRQLAEVAAGLLLPSEGRVIVGGSDITGRGPRAARTAGLAYVPEDRRSTGLAPSLTIAENLQLTSPHRPILNRRHWHSHARSLMDEYDIRAPGPNSVTSDLSGGNIQKVLLARELSTNPLAIVSASPTQGLDVGAIASVRKLLFEHCARGSGVLLITEDLEEIMELSDRVVVLYEGRIVHEGPTSETDVTEVGLAMAGAMRVS